MKKLVIILMIILGLLALVPSMAQTQEIGRYNFFTDFEVATGYWCYESNCATTKDTPTLYATMGQVFIGNYVLKTVYVKLNPLQSTSLTVRIECRADILSGVTPYWTNIWTKTYSAATTGLSGSDPIGEIVNVAEYCTYVRVGSLVTSDQTGDKLTVHGSFKVRQ